MAGRGRPRGFDKDQALRRAMDVFWTRGYQGASMAELTKAMDLTPPSLYAAFGDKEALFRSALQLYSTTEGSGIWTGVETAPTAREAVDAVLRATAEAFTCHAEPRGCMIVLSALQSESPHPEICDELKALRTANIDLLQNRFERAKADGELPENADCRALALFVTTLQHGMSIQARDGADRTALNAVADCAMAGWDAMVRVP
ncbi:MAG: TetR/AcrR family transcriptional regulator [Alphaproteobacteria bacterium]|nr:TetR/AcrR family transcriptional regulator [Alphaproteobacteria bacterium]